MANCPAVITCTDVMADEHPELVVAYMKAMIKVGRWANENKHAAAVILNRQTFYRDVEDTYQGIKDVDMVPNLSPQNLVSIEIGKDFMLSHGYIKRDFDVHEWAAPQFLEEAAKQLLEEEWTDGHHRQAPRAHRARRSATPASADQPPSPLTSALRRPDRAKEQRRDHDRNADDHRRQEPRSDPSTPRGRRRRADVGHRRRRRCP